MTVSDVDNDPSYCSFFIGHPIKVLITTIYNNNYNNNYTYNNYYNNYNNNYYYY